MAAALSAPADAKVVAAVSHAPGRHPGVDSASVTVSLGVAQANADDATIHDALKRADRALYQAKQRGRDRVVAV